MNPIRRPALIVSLAAFAAGCVASWLAPSWQPLERLDAMMTRIAAGFGHVELSGTGTRNDPRVLLRAATPSAQAPVCYLDINNNPQGIFESSPPSPSDTLVILNNLQQLGHKSVALAIPLAWDEPDNIALAAVDAKLGSFDHAIIGVPLQHGITPQSLPPAFFRASLPLHAVHGSAGALPIVNGLAGPKLATDPAISLGAFSRLESEMKPTADSHGMISVPLIARWDENIVLSFPLAVAMARFGVNANELVIEPGKHILLGDHGPVIPIDIHGQAVFPAGAGDGISAPVDSVIRENPSAPVPAALQPGAGPLVVRDERSGHEAEAACLGDAITGILRSPHGMGAKTLARLPVAAELALLAWCAALCGLAEWWKRHILWRRVSLVAGGFALPYACVLAAGYWTAPLVLATVFLVALSSALMLRRATPLHTKHAPAPAVRPDEPDQSPSDTAPSPGKNPPEPQSSSPAAKSPRKSGPPRKKPSRKKKRP